MTSPMKKMERRKIARELKRQLAIESIFAVNRLRKSGQLPTHDDSPLLMCVWERVRNHVLNKSGEAEHHIGGIGMPLRFNATALWDEQKRLSKFTVYDSGTGSLLLVGDMNGPVFPLPAVQAATENHSQTNESATS